MVLGNGESRKHLNLTSIIQKSTLIGCNGIHRDHYTDYICCCDKRMVSEVLARKKSKVPFIYTREKFYSDFNKLHNQKRVRKFPNLPYEGDRKQDNPEHWGSGPYAVLLAAELGFKKIYMAGFDLYGTNYLINNIYKGTQNYNPSTSRAVDPSFWIYQINKVFQQYSETDFFVYNFDTWTKPKEWDSPNVKIKNIRFLENDIDLMLNNSYNKSED